MLTFNQTDYSYTIVPQQFQTLAEVGIGLMVSNAPLIRPALEACLSGLRISRKHRTSNRSSFVQTSHGTNGQFDDDAVQLTNSLKFYPGNTATTIEANADNANSKRKSFSHWFSSQEPDFERAVKVNSETTVAYDE